MKSHTTSGFRKRFAALPPDVRNQARAAYRLFLGNPHHPSLHFKRVHETEPSDQQLQWKALTGPSAGTSGNERIYTIVLAPHLYFISWVESNGTTVSNVVDLSRMRVAAFVTFQGATERQAVTDEGSIREIAAP